MNYVFDLYGTLVDVWTDEEKPQPWQRMAELLGEGIDSAEEIRLEYKSLCAERYRGDEFEIDLLDVFREMLISRDMDKDFAPALANEFRVASRLYLRRFHGVLSMLRELKRKGGVYLLSNAQSCFTLEEIRLLGLYPMFDGIIISSDTGAKKPSQKIFEIAFQRFKITPENSVYVGNDMHDDVLGASSVGMKTVYIETKQSRKKPENMTVMPTYVVKNHREMKKLLLSLA